MSVKRNEFLQYLGEHSCFLVIENFSPKTSDIYIILYNQICKQLEFPKIKQDKIG